MIRFHEHDHGFTTSIIGASLQQVNETRASLTGRQGGVKAEATIVKLNSES
jgi:hypothetical protein